MDRSDIQETLLTLFLRLNGYFATGYIVHAAVGNRTEMDALAIRFPYQQEPEREVPPSTHLHVSDSLVDFLVCEVKGGADKINFNYKFRDCPGAIRSVLERFGAFTGNQIESLIPTIMDTLKPDQIHRQSSFPAISVSDLNIQIRFILVAPDQLRPKAIEKPYLFGDDIIDFIWKCFRPEARRVRCDTHYNRDLWGEQYSSVVQYFKVPERQVAGSIEEVYKHFNV